MAHIARVGKGKHFRPNLPRFGSRGHWMGNGAEYPGRGAAGSEGEDCKCLGVVYDGDAEEEDTRHARRRSTKMNV